MQMTKGLWFAICAQLLLFVGVHSVPLGTSEDNQVISQGADHLEGVTVEGQDSQNFEEVEEPLPLEVYQQEIQEQVEAPRNEGEQDLLVRDTRSTCPNTGTDSINHMLAILYNLTCQLQA